MTLLLLSYMLTYFTYHGDLSHSSISFFAGWKFLILNSNVIKQFCHPRNGLRFPSVGFNSIVFVYDCNFQTHFLFIWFFFEEQLALEYFPLWYPREPKCSEKVLEWLPCPLFGLLLSLSLPFHKWNPDYLSYETFFLDFVIQKLICRFYALSYQKRFLQFISFSLEFHCNIKSLDRFIDLEIWPRAVSSKLFINL